MALGKTFCVKSILTSITPQNALLIYVYTNPSRFNSKEYKLSLCISKLEQVYPISFIMYLSLVVELQLTEIQLNV